VSGDSRSRSRDRRPRRTAFAHGFAVSAHAADSRGLAAAGTPPKAPRDIIPDHERAGQGGGASKNRTCDLILIRDAL
jgi:hypothetical protein